VAKSLSKEEKLEIERYSKTPANTPVEVVRIEKNGTGVRKKKMSFMEFMEMDKLEGYNYLCYQIGVCSIPESK